MRAGVGTPATPWLPPPPSAVSSLTFNESRGRNPGNTTDKRRPHVRGHPFNESRGRNPGNTEVIDEGLG